MGGITPCAVAVLPPSPPPASAPDRDQRPDRLSRLPARLCDACSAVPRPSLPIDSDEPSPAQGIGAVDIDVNPRERLSYANSASSNAEPNPTTSSSAERTHPLCGECWRRLSPVQLGTICHVSSYSIPYFAHGKLGKLVVVSSQLNQKAGVMKFAKKLRASKASRGQLFATVALCAITYSFQVKAECLYGKQTIDGNWINYELQNNCDYRIKFRIDYCYPQDYSIEDSWPECDSRVIYLEGSSWMNIRNYGRSLNPRPVR